MRKGHAMATITLDPAVPIVGQDYIIGGSGFEPGMHVDIRTDDSVGTQDLGDTHVQPDGTLLDAQDPPQPIRAHCSHAGANKVSVFEIPEHGHHRPLLEQLSFTAA